MREALLAVSSPWRSRRARVLRLRRGGAAHASVCRAVSKRRKGGMAGSQAVQLDLEKKGRHPLRAQGAPVRRCQTDDLGRNW